jgi:signal transduction histidine kinase
MPNEHDILRHVVRQLSEVPDSEALLTTLCESVIATVHADGTAVEEVNDSEGIIRARAGSGTLQVGQRYPMRGSLTERALVTRQLVSHDDYATHPKALDVTTDQGPIGEIMLVPLMAAWEVSGVLVAFRHRGAVPFSVEERDRLQVIADHAAAVLHRARLLEDAKSAALAKTRLIASVSHELRTPLSALAGYGELLADEVVGPLSQSQRDVVERMRIVTQQLATMIDDLLLYSRLEHGNESLQIQAVTVGQILEDVDAVALPLARQKELEYQSVAAEPQTKLMTDPRKLRQVLVNLTGNAVKYTERGQVRVTATRSDQMVAFAVSDTGIGISAEHHRLIFEPFRQVEEGLTRRYRGTGLGLYIAQSLSHLLDGTIRVESEVARGSTFTLVMPLVHDSVSPD